MFELIHLGSDPLWLKTVSMLYSRRNWPMLNASEEMPQLTKHLSENIKDKLKGNSDGNWKRLVLFKIQFYQFISFTFKQRDIA